MKAEELRSSFLNGAASSEELKKLSNVAFIKLLELEKSLISEVRPKPSSLLFDLYWKKLNSEAQIVL